MRVFNSFNVFNKNDVNKTSKYPYSNLKPLAKDTVSFTAMNKDQFQGIDLIVVRKFKPLIEKFNSKEDLGNWCQNKVNEIISKEYPARQEESTSKRKDLLNSWFKYVTEENGAYTPAIQLLILDGITKDLDKKSDTLPPVLHKGVLADTVYKIENAVKTNKSYQPNFNKQYQNNLQALFLGTDENGQPNSNITGWVVIPSKAHDPEHFEENVTKLQTLSHSNWCTKSYNAEPYLSEGDFHIFLEQGKAKIGIRFDGDNIEEIEGEKNDSEVPLFYFDEINDYIKANDYKLNDDATEAFSRALKRKEKADKIKQDLASAIENNDVKEIFDYFNLPCSENEDGTYTIKSYRQPRGIDFQSIGIDENKLLEKIKVISKDANFKNSRVTNLGILESIGGSIQFNDSIKSLANLKNIGGNAKFTLTNVSDLGKLETIGEADFSYSKITDLKNLREIRYDASFSNSKIKNLGNLEVIGQDAYFKNSEITDLQNLRLIGGNAYFQDSKVENLGNLEEISGSAHICNSNVKDLGKLRRIGSYAYFTNSRVENLANLERIEGSAYFRGSVVNNIGNLNCIGGDVLSNDEIYDQLKTVTIGGKLEI